MMSKAKSQKNCSESQPMKTSELLEKMERKIECVLDITHLLVTVEQLKALDEAIKHFKQHESEEKDGNSI